MKVKIMSIIVFNIFFSSIALAASYPIGPFGGIVTSVVEDSGGTIFIGTEGGGIYKTNDNGDTWVPASSGLANPFVYALAMSKDNTIFAGTKAGIFKTTDKDMNWILESGVSKGHLIPSISTDKDGKVYASIWGSGVCKKIDNDWMLYSISDELHNTFVNSITFTKDGAALAATEGGVYGLDKAAKKWRFVGLLEYLVQSIVIDNNGHIYASVWGSGIQRSRDNGKEWEPIGMGANSYARHLSINQNNEMFAGTEDGVFKFSPDAKEWKSIGLKDVFIRNITPASNNRLFAGSYGKGIYISNDKGKTWQQKNNNITNMQIMSMFVDSENTLYVGTTWGLFKRLPKKDGGWHEIDKFSGKEVKAVAGDSKGSIYVGTPSGIFRYDADNKAWGRVKGAPGYANISTIHINNSDNIFAGTDGEGLFLSSDRGDTWRILNDGLTNQRILTIALNNQSMDILIGTSDGVFAGTMPVLKDFNSGNEYKFKDISSNIKNRIVQSIVIEGNNIYAGTDGGGVFVRTGDGGWSNINNGLKNTRILSMFSDGKGNVYAGTYDGMYSITRGSLEWDEVSKGLINRVIQTLNIDRNGNILIGTWGGGIWGRPSK